MADRDRWEDPDVDDWFVDADVSEHEVRAPRVDKAEERTQGRQALAADDWLADVAIPTQAAGYRSRLLGAPAKVGLAVCAFVVVLLGGLAAAGVFTHAQTMRRAVTSTSAATTSPTSVAPSANKSVGVLPASALKPGDTGAQVVDLQHALARLGYAPGVADGNYGPATQRAVERLQRASGLSADGIFGPKTLTALRRAAAGK